MSWEQSRKINPRVWWGLLDFLLHSAGPEAVVGERRAFIQPEQLLLFLLPKHPRGSM